MKYRQHASVGVLRNDTYYKHVCAMTDEKLRDKSEIAEELAVRDMRIKELEAKLAAMTQERDKAEALRQAAYDVSVRHGEQLAITAATLESKKTLLAACEEQLAASQAREKQLREALEICQAGMPGDKWDSLYIDGVLAFPQDDTALNTLLAAGQAREQQLREALKAIQHGFATTHQVNAVVVHALSLPQDDTALRQQNAKLLREEVERCAADLENTPTPLSVKGLAYEEVCAFIRIVARTIRHSRKADELEAGSHV